MSDTRLEAELARWDGRICAEAAKWPAQWREDFAQDARVAAIRAIRLGHGRHAGYMLRTITRAVEAAAERAHLIRRRRLVSDRDTPGAGRGVWRRDDRVVLGPLTEEMADEMRAANDTEAEALAHIEAPAQLDELDLGAATDLRDALNLRIRRIQNARRRLPQLRITREQVAARLAEIDALIAAAEQGRPVVIGNRVRKRTRKR